jgi:hypothetical protein
MFCSGEADWEVCTVRVNVHGDERKSLIWVLMVELLVPAGLKSFGFVERRRVRMSVGSMLPGNQMKLGEIV